MQRNKSLYFQLWLLLLGALVVLWGAVGWNYRSVEAGAMRQLYQQTSALSLAFAEHTAATFGRVDHVLIELRDDWRNALSRDTVKRAEGFHESIALRTRGLSETAFQVAIIDAEGYLSFSSLTQSTERVYLGDREHFSVHRAGNGDKLFVSRPVKGRVSGKWSIQFSRPIFRDGRFSGVIVLSVDPGYFVRFYQKVDLRTQGVVAMLRDTGEVMARSVDQEKYIGKLIDTSPYTTSTLQQGHLRRAAQTDGIDRLYGYYRVAVHGLTLVVGVGVDEQLESVRDQQHMMLLIASVVSLVLALMVWHLARGLAYRDVAEARLQLAASVFTNAREGIMITDVSGKIVEVNETFSRITGYSYEEAKGQNPRILNSGRQPPEHYAAMWESLKTQGYWNGEVWNRRKSGEVYAEILSVSAVQGADGKTQNYVALFTDITPLKEHQQQLEHIAHYDALTGLPNRVLLADRMQQAMAQSLRRKRSVAVVFLDLDGFKVINDTHGHEMGDELLIAVSRRMKTALRDGDSLARMGGDEFVAVLVDLESPDDCEPVLARLLEAAAAPVFIDTLSLQVSASIGVTLYPQDGVDADLLMRHADQAMYQAKQAGKNRYHLFDVAHDAAVKTQRESLDHIRDGLDRSEFVLFYQPKVNMKTGEVIGAEALIRWQHPEFGLLGPSLFLPVVNDHPLSIEIGEWVIATALAQISVWRTAGLDILVSVNIDARQLQQDDFVARLEAQLAAHPAVRPRRLEIEILETSALEDIAKVADVMHACRNIGVGFALDDFGTGYSSLTYLRRLPAHLLKIDQSFVRDMLDDPEDMAIVEAVIGLATSFRRQVIAEGVETVAHGELLVKLGCEQAQGFGISRPMAAADMPGWIAGWRPDPAWKITHKV